MKFWQKTFICTLVLFLVCFGSGIFALALFFNGQLVENCENTCLAEQFYIAKSFAADCEYTVSTGGSVKDLMMSYSDYYLGEGISLVIVYGDETTFHTASSEVSEIILDGESWGEGEREYFQRRVGGTRYIFIKSELDDGYITYVKDVSYLDDDWRAIAIIFVSISLCVTVVLAAVLFVILKRLSSPLSKLTRGVEAVAEGDYSVRTSVSGGDEFSELSDGFNHMTEQISEQIAALELVAEQKQRLVDDLSHEMRTPLTSIHGYAEYLLNAAVGEEERIDALICIMTESERLSKLSQSLLDISYAGNAPLTRMRVSLSEIFRGIENRFGLNAKNAGVELCVEETNAAAFGDVTLLELLFSNLTDNAVKACRDSAVKRVTVRAEETEGGRVRVTVTDTGRGMSEEELRHITEPFYRTDKARSRADGGAGLGLALCRRIAESHGGKMEFSSVIGQGTTVSVVLESA